jgi:hypothetical protein
VAYNFPSFMCRDLAFAFSCAVRTFSFPGRGAADLPTAAAAAAIISSPALTATVSFEIGTGTVDPFTAVTFRVLAPSEIEAEGEVAFDAALELRSPALESDPRSPVMSLSSVSKLFAASLYFPCRKCISPAQWAALQW